MIEDIPTEICCDDPFPTFASLHDQLEEMFKVPNVKLEIPELPTAPSPMYPDIGSFQTEAVNFMQELQLNQMFVIFSTLLSTVTDFLGMDLEGILPSMPGWPDSNLITILEGEINELLASIPDDIHELLEDVKPNPTYPDYSIPTMDALDTVQFAVRNYGIILMKLAIELVEMVTDLLQIPGLPAFPEIPTLQTLYGLLSDLFPDIPEYPKVPLDYEGPPELPEVPEIPKFTLEMLNEIEIPGFDFKLEYPSPLIPNVTPPTYDFVQALKGMWIGLVMEIQKKIVEFVDEFLPIPKPTICIPTPAVQY